MRKNYTLGVLLLLCLVAAIPVKSVQGRELPEAAMTIIPVADFYKRSPVADLKISPNGNYIAATMSLEEHTDLIVLDRVTLKVISRVVFKNKSHVDDFYWVSPSRIIFTEKQKAGLLNEPRRLYGIYAVNADGSDNRRITNDRLLDTLVNEDDWVLVEQYGVVKRLNVHDGKVEKTKYKSPATVGFYITDNAGNVRFFSGSRGRELYGRLFRYVSETNKWQLVNAEAESGQDFDVLGFSTDNQTAYMAISKKSGPSAVYAFDMITGQKKMVSSDDNVNPDYALSGSGSSGMYGIRYLDGRPRNEMLDATDPNARDLLKMEKAFAGYDVFPMSSSGDGSLAIYYVYADDHPGTYYLYDRANAKASYLLDRQPWIDNKGLSKTEPVKFKAKDGLEIEAFLTLPKHLDRHDLPAVVLVHGGPFGIFDQWGYSPEVQMLANRGYAVLQVNFRGSGNYGHAFETAGYRQWGAAMQDDITDATQWLIQQKHADKQRICIYGASYGAYAALMGSVKEPDLYQCAIGNVGVYDMNKMLTDDTQYYYGPADVRVYALTLGLKNLGDISPNLKAHKIKADVLLGAGREDETAPPIHTERMRDAILKAGGSVDTVIYEGEDHGNYLYKNQIDWADRVLNFLDKNIGPSSQEKH